MAARRAGIRLAGFGLIGLTVAMAAALLTANASDPSFNTAADGPVQNLVGTAGAIFADLMLQTLGVAGLIPITLLAAWGFRMAGAADVPKRPSRRITLGIVAMMGGAITGAGLLDGSMLPAGPGGAVGSLGLAGFVLVVPPDYAWVVIAVAALVTTAAWIFALGLERGDADGLALGVRTLSTRFAREPTAERPTGNDRIEPTMARAQPETPPPPPPEPRAAPIVEPKRAAVVPSKRDIASRQGTLDLGEAPAGGYARPPLDLLGDPPETGLPKLNQDALSQNAKVLESVLEDFGVTGRITKVRPGPVVTLYELEPAPGIKTARVIGLADDIARSMSALSVRIATVPGRSVIGIELPNARRETVYLRELMAADVFEKAQAPLTLVLGKDIGGAPVMADLARMPHLLVAGTTGSGKSVAINTMILSLLYRLSPDECRLILVDPKMLELSIYDGIPHLLTPVVTEPGKAVVALKWAVREMEDRYRAMSQLNVRNIGGYNQRLAEAAKAAEVLTRKVQTGFDPDTGKPTWEEQVLPLDPLPHIVVVVDEMADLMLVAGKDIEGAVQRLAQMARAAGIHLIMATQRPSVDVITGTIKANFPTRISFQVTSKIDSRTILGEQGAEQLLGQGDMLYMASGGRIQRVHGPFVSDEEVDRVVRHLRDQGEPRYLDAVTEDIDTPEPGGGEEGGNGGGSDDLYDQAVALVAREGKASTSFIQRQLQIGYNRAARLVERMEKEGVVGKANHVGKREVLVRRTHEDF